MDIAVTQKDIARHLGISRSTVVQALNGIGRVQPETRDKVLQAAHELGYRPNPMARALVSGKTERLALWYYPMLDPNLMEMANELQMLVPPYNLVVANLGLYKPSSDSYTEQFPPAEWPVDGIFAYDTGLPEHILSNMKGAPPMVYIDTELTTENYDKRVDTILIDMRPGTEAAIRHLVATRQRVAMLCLESLAAPDNSRAIIYEQVLREAGREPEYIPVPVNRYYRDWAYRAFREYVKENGCPDAIFCTNDEQAAAVNCALYEMGRRVPEDVALIGFDNQPEARYQAPPLSTVALPLTEICQVAWRFLKKRLEEPDTPHQLEVITAEWIERESSAA